jgi:phosphoglycerate dehydrogenase-like enzyme
MRLRIALIDDYLGLALHCADWTCLDGRAELTVFRSAFASEDAAAAALQGFDVVVTMRERTPFPASLLARLPELKLLVSTGPRNGTIDREACARQGVTLCGTRGAATGHSGTAEQAWALILALVKRIPNEHVAMLAGRWQTGPAEVIDGRTLGILGLGRIGERVARGGLAFGMRVIAWSQNLTPERAAAAGVEWVPRQELFRQADILSLHLALSERTRHLVRRDDLYAMKRSALLVNTARAGLIEPGALMAALGEKWIAGAGLDVFDIEPLPSDDPLLQMDNVVLTPHLGYVTRDNYRAFYGGALENIVDWIEGRPMFPFR